MIELKPRGNPDEQHPDGVRIIRDDGKGRRNAFLWQALGLFLVASCVGYLIMPSRRPLTAPPAGDEQAGDIDAQRAARFIHSPTGADPSAVPGALAGTQLAGAAPGSAGASSRRLTPRKASKRPSLDPPEEMAEQPKPGDPQPPDIDARDYIQALHDAGIYEGIGAFNPPGTSPPLEGLAVPPDFELPEGYVRHFQTTDDGQSIDPILMFHPDFEFLDENGQPVPIPEDRVVPPEYVPPGFPLRPIEIPTEKRPIGDTGRR